MRPGKDTWITALASGIAAILLWSTEPGHAIDGPSFDCGHGVNTALAMILCNSSDAATADWNMSSAFWAAFKGDKDEKEQNAFNRSISLRCSASSAALATRSDLRISSAGGSAHHGSARQMRDQRVRHPHRNVAGQLQGDALSESRLTPEKHIEIQQALIVKGLLQNQVQKYRANADGQFGPNTRAAIWDYQRSIGARPTGFLSDQQRLALLESPRRLKPAQPARQPKPRLNRLRSMRRNRLKSRRSAPRNRLNKKRRTERKNG